VHPDARVDALQRAVERAVREYTAAGCQRTAVFQEAWKLTRQALAGQEPAAPLPPVPLVRPRATIPYLTEPWYC